MGEEEKKTLGVFYYQDAKGDWHPVGDVKPIELTAFSIEDLWQAVAEVGNPPRSDVYIITIAAADVPFEAWPVQIGWFESGRWMDMNGREIDVTAWIPMPAPFKEGGGDG